MARCALTMETQPRAPSILSIPVPTYPNPIHPSHPRTHLPPPHPPIPTIPIPSMPSPCLPTQPMPIPIPPYPHPHRIQPRPIHPCQGHNGKQGKGTLRRPWQKRRGGGIEPLHVSMPRELKSRPSTSAERANSGGIYHTSTQTVSSKSETKHIV